MSKEISTLLNLIFSDNDELGRCFWNVKNNLKKINMHLRERGGNYEIDVVAKKITTETVEQTGTITLHINKQQTLDMNCSDIRFIKPDAPYTVVIIQDNHPKKEEWEKLHFIDTLDEIADQLTGKILFRANRSLILHIDEVDSRDYLNLFLKDGGKTSIGKYNEDFCRKHFPLKGQKE